MIRHIVFFSAKRHEDVDAIAEGLRMLGQIPHSSVFEVMKNTKTDILSDEVDVVVYAEFEDEAALAAYKADPIYAECIRRVRPLREIVHTMGWPLPMSAFGGSFMYPMGDDLISLGIVVGLDYRDHALDAHELLQRMKTHPLFRPHFEGGELVEWGAKTIPEGGLYSLPSRLHGDGVLIAGDAAGLFNVAALKGIHYAIHSGILAARDRGLYSAITDCGAGGFSSAVGEMGEHTGAEVWLEKAPLKYAGLSYAEIWISEAQERMVLAVPPANWEEFHALCRSEDVEATVIGEFTTTNRLVLKYHGTEVADLSMEFLHDGRPPVVRLPGTVTTGIHRLYIGNR